MSFYNCILGLIKLFLRQIRVTVARQAEQQVVGIFPGLDDNPFENDIINHGNLHLTGT